MKCSSHIRVAVLEVHKRFFVISKRHDVPYTSGCHSNGGAPHIRLLGVAEAFAPMTSAAQHVTLSDLREEFAASSNRIDVRACHQFRFFNILPNNFSAPMPFLCLEPSIRHYSLIRTVHCFKDIHVSNETSSAKVGFCHGRTRTGFLIWNTAPVVAGSGRQCASTKQPEPSFPLCALCGGWDRGVLGTAMFSASV